MNRNNKYLYKIFINNTQSMLFLTGTLLFLLSGVGSAHAGSTQTGVVATAASDFSSYAVSTISVDPKAGPRIAVNNLLSGSKGSTVKAYGRYYYRLEQFQADNVTKVDITAPNSPDLAIFNPRGTDETNSSNPYDLVFVSSTKAYLIRYGATKGLDRQPFRL